MPTPHPTPAPRTIWLSLLADVVLVILFAAIGRASHDEGILGENGLGLLQTSWPFVVSLLIGWAAMRLWRFPTAILNAGISVWLYTVIGGMLLRGVSGQGVQMAFAIVTAIVLGLFLVGWRIVVALLARRRPRTDP
ncbi:DUF3054 domain-containing protein [Microbacterium sediminicola]|uniref:DUF3054 domain-containing protein n=1 Tax=Microbacterium sediminicola TaxID=415210 RepID=A0ABN2HWX7_9MICO